MGTNRWSLLVTIVAALLVSACTAIPQQQAVKTVHVCTATDCGSADQKYSTAQLLAGLQRLLKENEGAPVTVCNSDPTTRTCGSVGFCYFVLGGILPGNGCAKSIVFSEIAISPNSDQLSLKAKMPLTFIWTPVSCDTMTGTLSVRAPDEISIEFKPYYCNWMKVGPMTATFNVAVESLDLSRGQIGVYLSHAVKGGGNGRGSGYVELKFPKSMPDGDNWLADQPVVPTAGKQLTREVR